MVLTSIPLQIGLGDIISAILGNTFALSITILAVSGYIFVALTARQTKLWGSSTSGTERTLIAIGVAMAFELVVYFFILAIIYTLFHGQTNDSGVYYLSVIFAVILLDVTPLALWANRANISESTSRKIFAVVFQIISLVAFALSIISLVFYLTSFLFPPEVRNFLSPSYGSDFASWFFAFAIAFIVYYIYSGLFYAKLPIYKMTDYFKSASSLASSIDKFSVDRISRRKIASTVLLGLVISTILVTSDYEFGLISPTVTLLDGQHQFLNAATGDHVAYELGLMTSNTLKVNSTGSCQPTVYQQRAENISIRTPLFSPFSLNNLTIANPSNVSMAFAHFTEYVYPSNWGNQIWQTLFVSNPQHLQITPSPSAYNIQRLDIGISNTSSLSSAQVGLVYSVPVSGQDFTCVESLARTFLSNKTVIIRHSFSLRNGGNMIAQVVAIRLSDYLGYNVNASSLMVYRNETAFFAFNSNVLMNNGWLYSDYFIIPSFHTENYTIIFKGTTT